MSDNTKVDMSLDDIIKMQRKQKQKVKKGNPVGNKGINKSGNKKKNVPKRQAQNQKNTPQKAGQTKRTGPRFNTNFKNSSKGFGAKRANPNNTGRVALKGKQNKFQTRQSTRVQTQRQTKQQGNLKGRKPVVNQFRKQIGGNKQMGRGQFRKPLTAVRERQQNNFRQGSKNTAANRVRQAARKAANVNQQQARQQIFNIQRNLSPQRIQQRSPQQPKRKWNRNKQVTQNQSGMMVININNTPGNNDTGVRLELPKQRQRKTRFQRNNEIIKKLQATPQTNPIMAIQDTAVTQPIRFNSTNFSNPITTQPAAPIQPIRFNRASFSKASTSMSLSQRFSANANQDSQPSNSNRIVFI